MAVFGLWLLVWCYSLLVSFAFQVEGTDFSDLIPMTNGANDKTNVSTNSRQDYRSRRSRHDRGYVSNLTSVSPVQHSVKDGEKFLPARNDSHVSSQYGINASLHNHPWPRFLPDLEFEPAEEDMPEVLPDTNSSTDVPFNNSSISNVESTFLNWTAARDFCETYNGELACLERADVQRIIKDTTDFTDGDVDFVQVWTRNHDCDNSSQEYKENSIAKIQLDLQLLITTTGTSSTRLPFYCLIHPSNDTTSTIVPVTTPSIVPVTSPVINTSTLTTSSPTPTTSTSSTTTVQPNHPCCPSKEERGLLWPLTCDDRVPVTLKCPKGQVGAAVWNCVNGFWFPTTPDLSGCKSSEVTDILKTLNASDVAGSSDTLSRAASKAHTGGDVIVISEAIKNVALSLKNQANLTESAWLGTVENVTKSVADSMNSFLGSSVLWTDIPEKERVEVADELLSSVKKIGFALAYALQETNVTVEKDHVFLQAIKEKRGSFSNRSLVLPLVEDSSNKHFSVTFNPGFENDVPEDGTDLTYTFILLTSFENMEDILLINDDQLTSFNVSKNMMVNSRVLGLSFTENDTTPISLSNEMVFVVAHREQKATSPICAFWNVVRKNWDSTGCVVVSSTDSHTVCACDHLTNFAVLMDFHGAMESLSEEDKDALITITYVGCIISIIALSLCVLITTTIRELWCMRNTIHRNLALCLLIGEVFLITGLDRTEYKLLCSVIAGFLHYFFLSAFFWMLLEAVFIYILLVKVFAQRRSYAERYYLCGFGIPLLIVVISAGVNPEGYGTKHYCWLSAADGMAWSFGGPVLIIVLINLAALIFALHIAVVMSKKNADDNIAAARQWILGAMTLLPFLGVTWGVGFLFSKDYGPTGAYIFTILNSLQGLAIFVVQILLNVKVRTKLRRKIEGRFATITQSSRSGTRNDTGNSRSMSLTSHLSSSNCKDDDGVRSNDSRGSASNIMNQVNAALRNGCSGKTTYHVTSNNPKRSSTNTDIAGLSSQEDESSDSTWVIRFRRPLDDTSI